MVIPRSAATLALLLLFAGCGGDEASATADPGGGGPGGEGGPTFRFAGPLANAGADQRALPGLPVRLDGRASSAGEEGLAIALRWTQVAGPRVALDDPAAAEPTFVAPPIRGPDGDRLVFLLTVDDGQRTSADRVAVHLVDEPRQLLPAPIALAGGDLAVRRGAPVELPEPFTLDPACLDEGGAPGCEIVPIPTRYVQVEGPPIALNGRRFVAPEQPAVLTFRLDGHRGGGEERLADCAPGGALQPRAFCSAADHLRVHVLASGIDSAPRVDWLTADLGDRDPLQMGERGGLLRVGHEHQAAEFASSIRFEARATDADFDRVLMRGFRPLLPGAPRGPLDWDSQRIELGAGVADAGAGRALGDFLLDEAAWPRTVAVAFEARAARLLAPPAVAAVRWEPPADAALPVADAGPDPCAAPNCTPFEGGEQVVLDGSGSHDPDTPAAALTYCWHQTFGPPVALDRPACVAGDPVRTFVAPPPPERGTPLLLAFALTVSDGGPLVSLPDTALVQIRPPGDRPPQVILDAPAEVEEGAIARLDAAGSIDPDGGRLTFRWRQVAPLTPRVELVPDDDCTPLGAEGACVAFEAPRVYADTPFRFRVTVSDETPLDASKEAVVVVRNSVNEPPTADAGPDLLATAGEWVEIEGKATDPNPGDVDALAWSWSVIDGEVSLETNDGPATRFVAPTTDLPTDVILELEVRDPAGATAKDRVTIAVVPAG